MRFREMGIRGGLVVVCLSVLFRCSLCSFFSPHCECASPTGDAVAEIRKVEEKREIEKSIGAFEKVNCCYCFSVERMSSPAASSIYTIGREREGEGRGIWSLEL